MAAKIMHFMAKGRRSQYKIFIRKKQGGQRIRSNFYTLLGSGLRECGVTSCTARTLTSKCC
jgi:hypothetical protein